MTPAAFLLYLFLAAGWALSLYLTRDSGPLTVAYWLGLTGLWLVVGLLVRLVLGGGA